MVSFDFSHIGRCAGTEVSGIIGYALLNFLSLKINYRDALVKFEYVLTPTNHYRRLDGTRNIEASSQLFPENQKR